MFKTIKLAFVFLILTFSLPVFASQHQHVTFEISTFTMDQSTILSFILTTPSMTQPGTVIVTKHDGGEGQHFFNASIEGNPLSISSAYVAYGLSAAKKYNVDASCQNIDISKNPERPRKFVTFYVYPKEKRVSCFLKEFNF